jgi:hypothetical protein
MGSVVRAAPAPTGTSRSPPEGVVLTACWSSKGGVGTTVVAAALAIAHAGRHPGGALLVDLAGDVPAVLGLPPVVAAGPGVADWLAAAPDVLPDALPRLEVPVPGLALAVLPQGEVPVDPGGLGLLASVLAGDQRAVVVDCGRSPSAALLDAADRSLLVLRPDYVAVARASKVVRPPTGVVLVVDGDRAIRRADVEAVLGVPVVAEVRTSDEVARAVDAGVLTRRLPRTLARALRHVA